MTTTNISDSWLIETLRGQQAASILHDEKKWKKAQAQAMDFFESAGIPNRKVENWKYTNLTALVQSDFTVPKTVESTPIESSNKEDEFYSVVFRDGRLFSRSKEELPKDVVISPLSEVLEKIDLNVIPEQYQTPFSALNLGLMGDGLFVFIPKNVILEKPIHFVYETAASGVMQHPRHVVIMEASSKATLIEEYRGGGSYFTNVVLNASIQSNASLEYCKLQHESSEAFHIANSVFDLKQDARLSAFHLGLGGRIARDDLNFSLEEKGADCQFNGLYLPRESQIMDYHTRVDHRVGYTHSRQFYKGTVDGKARAVFNGKVVVSPKAEKIVAHQNNANLLLSTQAEIDTKPELEIYADDVQCTHGATVGQLDEKALFYLQTRGISKSESEKMLTQAFSGEILNRISDQSILNYINRNILGETYV